MQLRRVRTWLALATWGVASALAGGAGCRTATQIVVEVESDQCARLHSTEVTVAGDEGALATKSISDASRRGCVAEPHVGTVVLVPDGDEDKEVVIRLVSGLDKPATTCREGDEGCIIARRRARFVPNEIVRVSVQMSLTCQRVVCNAGASCDPATGRCVDLDSSPDAPPSPDAGSPADAEVGNDGGSGCGPAGCVIECNEPKQCKSMLCLPGLPCVVNCNKSGACEDVDCGASSTCEVNCNVDDACRGKQGIRCGTASSCKVECRSRRACGAPVRCSCNGPCAVTCSAERCDAQDVHCCKEDGCDVRDPFECQGQCD